MFSSCQKLFWHRAWFAANLLINELFICQFLHKYTISFEHLIIYIQNAHTLREITSIANLANNWDTEQIIF